ncbi:MAG: hypothetical protein AAF321_00535 [Pseudomonadota bacterium]
MTPVLLAIALSAVFVLGTIALALGTYWVARYFGAPRVHEQTEGLGGSVAFRIAGLHGLILGLVFAQETQAFRDIQSGLLREATVVTDIFYDLDRYGTPAATEQRATVAAYARVVVESDWPSLRDSGRNAPESFQLWEESYEFVLDLEPESGRQEALRAHMLAGIHTMAELRQARENSADVEIPLLFWIAAVGGLVFVCVPYFVFAPTRLHLTLIAMFAGYTGLVIAAIYGFSNPFSPPAALEPTPFLRLLDGEIGAWPRSAS